MSTDEYRKSVKDRLENLVDTLQMIQEGVERLEGQDDFHSIMAISHVLTRLETTRQFVARA